MKLSRALLVVWLLIFAYGIYFSALSIQRHRAFLTHASDLGQIDQAIWNTLHGHLLEHTKATGVQNIRLSDHVEPIFIPLSLVFLIYDNVEALLIVQSFAIAIGALAVYWIARRRLGNDWAATGFAAMYLLFPALEAANLAEFHAVTLAPAPLLFAYHYGTERAWGRFAAFSILALAVKEEIALLVFMMGVWFVIAEFSRTRFGRIPISDFRKFLSHFKNTPRVPLAITLLAAAWGFVAVFVIIPHFNVLGKSPYTCRYVVSEDCPQIVRGLLLNERLGYLGQLLASAGWIALLDPITLLLGLPIIAANVLSNYPAQYSGTFHYSAPVAPYFVLAAIGGAARLSRWLARKFPTSAHTDARKRPLLNYRERFLASTSTLTCALIFTLAFAYHLRAGDTPIGGAFALPQISAHNQLFARFAAQIPTDAIVSTTTSLNPHLSHRRVLYRYPIVNDAEYVLLDVSESTVANPIDFRVAYNEIVDPKTFGVVDAADGYVLLKRGALPKPLPDDFFSFFRAKNASPQIPAQIDFGDQLGFLGYDVVTDQYGRGSVRMYWQRLKPMDKNYNLFLFYADDEGNPRDDVTLPAPILFWYPTSMWRQNEIVVGQTVPLDLGATARIGLAVLDGDNWDDVAKRLPARVLQPTTLRAFDNSTWVELGVIRKSGNSYIKE